MDELMPLQRLVQEPSKFHCVWASADAWIDLSYKLLIKKVEIDTREERRKGIELHLTCQNIVVPWSMVKLVDS